MLCTNRARALSKQGIEPLEGRLLLSGSPGHGDDGGGNGGDRFRPTASTQVAVADFNGDGKADIASLTTVNLSRKSSGTSLVVQLGKGDGTFAPASANVIAGGTKILAGDFNHDGKQDLAILGVDTAGNTSVTLYSGDGTGKFVAGTPQNVGVLPLANVGAGDVNGDGFSDLVAWNNGSVYVALNDGTGKLLPAVQNDNPFGTTANPVALGDLDGDGRPELVGVNGNQIYLNKAVASTGVYMLNFIPTLTNQIPLANKKLVVADVNGDGKNDFIALGDGSVNVALQIVAPGSSVLTFGPWIRTSADADLTHAQVGDVNGDGKADVFLPSSGDDGFGSRSRLTLISNGDGTFSKLSNHGKPGDHGDHDDGDDDDDQGDDD
jgi:hypothetical protein